MLAAMGQPWTETIARRYKGMNARDVAATAWRLLQPPGEMAYYQTLMRDALLAAYAQEPIVPMLGAVDLVRRLRGLAPLAVASGSPLPGLELALERLGIRDGFDAVISSESLARGKPAPDVFLAAAERLGAPPARCVVLEDSLVGVQAGRSAGMTVFAVPSIPRHRAAIVQLGARVFDSLADVTVADVLAVIGGGGR